MRNPREAWSLCENGEYAVAVLLDSPSEGYLASSCLRITQKRFSSLNFIHAGEGAKEQRRT